MSDKSESIYALTSAIERNYPKWPSTFGPCKNEKCNGSARGCGLCAKCAENDLGKIIGAGLAKEYHKRVRELASLHDEIRERAYDRDVLY